MTLAIDKESPPLVTDESGAIRVGASRVTLDLIVNAFNLGHTAESITENHTTLTLADVYAVIAYYLRHREVVDQYIAERRLQAESLRREIESQPGHRELRERLVTRGRDLGLRP